MALELAGRIKAALFDALGARFERRFGAALRRRALADTRGRVLEIGAGTGRNVDHYPLHAAELVLSEPSGAMRRRAERRARRSGRRVALVAARAEALPFRDGAFDTVVGTFVLCTVPDPGAALREIARVLAADGVFLFLEHVRSPDPACAKWQDRLERCWMTLADGCHPNRDTRAVLEAAGFSVDVIEQGELPLAPRLVRPYILGQAVKPPRRERDTASAPAS